MKKIKIMNEFLHDIIWCCDENGIEYAKPFEIIKQDEYLQALIIQARDMYNQYYEFDSHGVACWFNEEKQKQDKYKMLAVVQKILDRLKEINDGSFEIEDCESVYLQNL